MDPTFLVGIGPMYSDEILFHSGLRYDRVPSALTTQEIRRLYRAVVETVHEAIKYGGTTLGPDDLRARHVGSKDVVVGIAASGRTPYVLGALAYAKSVGALTVAVCCNAGSPVAAAAELPIEVVTGPEVLTGSTRLKAGTATKLVLNMLSTGAFVRLNKVYGNLMVDVQTTNAKLKARAVRIVAEAVACNETLAQQLLGQCDGEVKAAIVVGRKRVAPAVARTLLLTHDGSVRDALAAP
jgi:N-acetylmuramic acid 6-phosphate etherase